MRRFSDFDFNLLDISSYESILLTQIPQFPNDEPLNATVNGTPGDDVLIGTSGDDTLNGFGGNDSLDGLFGDNILTGGTGIDTFVVSVRGRHVTRITDFEDGIDFIDLSGIGISSFDQLQPFLSELESNVRLQFDNEFLFINNIALSISGAPSGIGASDFIFDDVTNGITIMGDDSGNTLFGSVGNDIITGGNTGDTLHGGDGDDVLDGGFGSVNNLYGGNGADTFVVSERGFHVTRIKDFQNGFDSIDLSGMGVSSFDQLDQLLEVSGSDVRLQTQTELGSTELFFIDNIARGVLDASDFIFDDVTNGITLVAGNGGSTLFGSLGNDILTGGSGADSLLGGNGADLIIGGAGADALFGGTGFDTTDYRSATSGVRFNVDTGGTLGDANGDTFSGIERYYLSNFNDIVTGSDANEFFFGEDGNDTINGGGGIDRIYGGDGDDIQRGEEGNDTLFGSAGADQLNGGIGTDVASYILATEAVGVNLETGGTAGDADGDTYFGIEIVFGSNFNDDITGSSGTNDLRGFNGDDELNGGGGNDRLFGGEGADVLDGGEGVDIANYTLAESGVTLDLTAGGTAGEALGDSFISIEWVFGSDFDDDITGDSGNNRLEGRDGNDTLDGAGGNDRLLGGDGNDTIHGGDGVDTIFGQDGDDILFGGADNDFFFGGAGADSHDGGSGTDTVSYLASSSGVIVNLQSGGTGGDAAGDTYTNIERVFGTSFDDSLRGSNNNDVLLGNGGADFLDGGFGNDTLIGGAGIDSFGYSVENGQADVVSGFFASSEVIFIYDTFGGESGPTDFGDLINNYASDSGANTIFDFGGGNTLTLIGLNIADLSASNFDFSEMLPGDDLLLGSDVFTADVTDSMDMDALI